jgi:hypothetical protein
MKIKWREIYNCQPKVLESQIIKKIVGPMKERGGPAGVILKNGYIAQWEIFIELI